MNRIARLVLVNAVITVALASFAYLVAGPVHALIAVAFCIALDVYSYRSHSKKEAI